MPRTGRYSLPDLIRSDNLKSRPGAVVELPPKLDDETIREEWIRQLADPTNPKIIDLFCGAGGMSEGFVSEGFTVAAAFDHNKWAVNTFAANIAARTVCADIAQIENPQEVLRDLDISQVAVVVGGPPCQGFSQVGKARIRSLKETEQTRLMARNELYQQFFRFVEVLKPLFFVMENVPTLQTFEEGAYINAIENESLALGYRVDYNIIDAADYGVPQKRRRLIIVGSRVGRLFQWPRADSPQDRIVLREAIGDLPKVKPPMLDEKQEYRPEGELSEYQRLMRSQVGPEDRGYIYDHLVRPVREDDIQIFQMMKPGARYTDIPQEYRRYNSESFKDKYYMLKPDAPGVTITAHLNKDGYRYIHWDREQHRTISVREAARIQSFGDHFRFTGSRSARFHQIGNAVPPLMARRIAEQIKRSLKRHWTIFPGDAIQLALPGYEIENRLVLSHE